PSALTVLDLGFAGCPGRREGVLLLAQPRESLRLGRLVRRGAGDLAGRVEERDHLLLLVLQKRDVTLGRGQRVLEERLLAKPVLQRVRQRVGVLVLEVEDL